MADNAQFVQLRLENDLTQIAVIAESTAEWAAVLSLPAKVIYEVNLALDEILTNIISYGYEDEKKHEISVALVYEQQFLVIEIKDDGKAFNPLEIELPNVKTGLKDRPVGGLGFYLVSQVMDQVIYYREEDKNILVLTKALL